MKYTSQHCCDKTMLSCAPLAQTSSYATADTSATKLNYRTMSSGKLSLLISKSFVGIKQSVISVA